MIISENVCIILCNYFMEFFKFDPMLSLIQIALGEMYRFFIHANLPNRKKYEGSEYVER